MIGILFTGGTISMQLDARTGSAIPALGSNDILALVPGMDTIAAVEVEDVARLPGPHVTPEHMWRLAQRTAAWLERAEVDGIVVTHGTDTLEETAYFLDVALISPKPVVLVGAMRTVSEPSWDGPLNLLNAVRVATASASRRRGVLVAMNEQILAAAEVQKVHTEAASSFQAREFGPLGVVDAGDVLYTRSSPQLSAWRDPRSEACLRVRGIETRVDLVKAVAGGDARFIDCSLASGARGLVVEAMGRGNVPPPMQAGIERVIAAGLPVVITSRCGAGSVRERYGYEGGGHELREMGAMFAGRLSGLKARMRLMIALGYSSDLHDISQIFESAEQRG
ncbi:MAG: asparaginase [Luteitalea sp.]|nr:asparaginase [Luteitalea sp.]